MKKYVFLILLFMPLILMAQPRVGNVKARQDGREIVIEYDLSAESKHPIRFFMDLRGVNSLANRNEIAVVALDGKPTNAAGHHKVAFRPLEHYNTKVWKDTGVSFKVGCYNEFKLRDKFTGDEGAVPRRQVTILPEDWRRLGFTDEMSEFDLKALLSSLGFHFLPPWPAGSIVATCNDLKLEVIPVPKVDGSGKKVWSSSAPVKWKYTVRDISPVYEDAYATAKSSKADYTICDDPEMQKFDAVILKLGSDDYAYYELKARRFVGVADKDLRIIIAPNRFENIECAGNLFVCNTSNPQDLRYLSESYIKKNHLDANSASLIAPDGTVIIDNFQGHLTLLGANGPVIASSLDNKKSGLYSRQGAQLTPFVYDFGEAAHSPEEKLIGLTTGGKNLKFVDYEGREVLSTKYGDVVRPFHNGYAVVRSAANPSRHVLIDRQGNPQVPESMLAPKGWDVTYDNSNLPRGYVAVMQDRKERAKGAKEAQTVEQANFIYKIHTGETFSAAKYFQANKAENHTFESAGNVILCIADVYENWGGKSVKLNRIVTVLDPNLKPLINYYNDYITEVIGDKYLAVRANRDIKAPGFAATFSLADGSRVADVYFQGRRPLGMLVPNGDGTYAFMDTDFHLLAPWRVLGVEGISGDDIKRIYVSDIELLKDVEGNFHYRAEDASPALRATMHLAPVPDRYNVYISPDGTLFGCEADAKSLRNRISDYLAPTTKHNDLTEQALDRSSNSGYRNEWKKVHGQMRQGDGEAAYTLYINSSMPAFLDRAIALGHAPAMAHKGYLLLATPDSILGQALLDRAAALGDQNAIAFAALRASDTGRYADAYEQFLALGDYRDSRHEAGLAALSRAYELYQDGNEGYAEWVDRAVDCDIVLAAKWTATIAKDSGDRQRCAQLYAKAADRGDYEAAYAAAVEYAAIGDYPVQEKYLAKAAAAAIGNADVELANLYLTGKPGVEASHEKAYPWLYQAYMRGVNAVQPQLKAIGEELANEALNAGRFAEAAMFAQGFVEADSLNWQAYDLLGRAMLADGNYAGAAQAYKRVLDLNPGNSNAQAKINDMMALQAEADAHQKMQQRIADYKRLAIKHNQMGESNKAIYYSIEACKLDPGQVWPYVEAAVAYYTLRDYASASDYCEMALSIDPDNQKAKYYFDSANEMLQAQQRARLAAQQQADKWQAIANLCSSAQQFLDALGNVTCAASYRSTPVAVRSSGTRAKASAASTQTASKSTSTKAKPSYTAADVQHRKTNQYVYDQYCSRIISMQTGSYPYSDGFTISELKDCQNAMRKIRTEWNVKHPDLPIYGSELENWSGR